ncbi:hypothetical protein A0J04_003291 [Listeria monocytogenes]|nr:hypothetical protein [Listeria monocytogenes]
MLEVREKRRSKAMFITIRTNRFIEQKHGKMLLILFMKEKVVAVKDVAALYLEGKRIGIM